MNENNSSDSAEWKVQARAAIQRSLAIKADARAFLSEMRRTLEAAAKLSRTKSET